MTPYWCWYDREMTMAVSHDGRIALKKECGGWLVVYINDHVTDDLRIIFREGWPND